MDLNLGHLVVGLVGDYSQLKADIEKAKTLALSQAKELERNFKISPTFDAKSLLESANSAGISAGKSIGQGLQSSLNSYKFSSNSFQKAGVEIAKGLSEGIKSGEKEVKNASAKMAGLVIDETKTKLRIRSPSKVFYEIGQNIVQGLAAGIGTGSTLAIGNLIESTISTAKSTVDGALSFTGASISTYSSFKAIRTQLEGIQGSSAAATDSLRFLRGEAERLALPLLDSAKGFASITAATKGTALEWPKTRDIYSGIAIAAREANLSNDDFNGVLLATTQIISKGRVSAEELRGQIGERLPGAFQKAASSIGVTTQQLDKLLESGQLTAEVFLPAFAKELSNVSAANITRFTDNSAASLTKLNNRLDDVKISLGQAIEPGVVAGLDFIQTTLNELGKAGLFDDLNRGAKDFASYLKENPELAKQTATAIRGALKDAIATTVNLAQKLTDYLQQNPTAVRDAGTAVVSFGKGISDAVGFAQNLLAIFQNIAKTVDSAYTKASKLLGGDSEGQSRFKNFLRVGPLSLIPGLGLGGNSTPNPIPTPSQGLRISESVGGSIQQVRSYADLEKHHPSSGREPGRDYASINGQLEEIRRTQNGALVKKDFILQNAQGNSRVDVPSPVSGYVRNSKDFGTSAIYSKKEGGELLAKILHLDPNTFKFNSGDFVQYGQPLGTQSGTGKGGIPGAYGVHSHVEVAASQFQRYIQDILDGVFDKIVTNAKTSAEMVKQSVQPIPTQQGKKKLIPTASNGWMRTTASTYGAGDGFDGKPTASGERFNKNAMTAAINENLKKNLGVRWGDRVEAINPANGKSVIVRITDSGPYEKDKNGRYVPHSTRGLDLSTAAAKEIGISLGEVAFRVLGKNSTVAQNSKLIPPSSVAPQSTALGQQPPEIRAILEGQKLKDQQARRLKFRESATQMQQSLRIVQDLDYGSIKNPSLSDRQLDEVRKLEQRHSDALRDAGQRQEDAKSRVGINTARLSSGSVPKSEASDLQLQINLDKRSITELDGVIKRLTESRANAAKELAKFQAQQTATRQRGVNSEAIAGEVSILQAQIQALRQLSSITPTAPALDALPKLDRELALKQAQLDLDRKLGDITDREGKNDITTAEAESKLDQLRRENELLISNISIQYQSAEAARTLAKARRELEYSVKENTAKVEGLRSLSQLRGIGIGTGDRLGMDRDANTLDLKTRYAQDKFALSERARTELLTPDQTRAERVRLALRFSESNLLNNASYQRSTKEESLSNSRYVQKTEIDLLNARGEALQGLGLDYSNRSIQKQVAVMNQSLSFQSAIAELEKLKESTNLTSDEFTQAKSNLETINSIKLDSINNQFNDFTETLNSIKSDSQSAFKDLILNTEDFGSSISKIFENLLGNLANMASQMLSDQLFGSIFGMKGQNTGGSGGGFGSIFSSIGSLFGGGSSGGGIDYSSFLGGFASGGMVGDIARTMSKERSISGREPRLIVANVGERVLNPQETQTWNRLQKAGQLPTYSDGGMVGVSAGSVSVQTNNSAGVNVGGISVVVGGSDANNVNVAQLQKVLEAKIQATIKQERRPGGSLARGSLYNGR